MAGASLLADAARRFRRNRPAMFGLALVFGLVAFAILGPVLSSHSPWESDFSLPREPGGGPPGPSAAHWLGTDTLFRDTLSRLAHGARLSLGVAAAATVISTTLGAAVGVAAGWFAGTRLGFVDGMLMRVVDVLLALPYLLFVTAIGVAVGRADVGTVLLVLGLTGWTGVARVVRAKTLMIKELDYVHAARALGATPARIVVVHVLPNVATTLIVVSTGAVAHMILAEAVLGYLTVGVPPPRPSWGRMLHEAEPYLGLQPSLVAAPGFAILLAVLGFNRVGDGLRDALDPRGRAAPSRARRGVPVDVLIVAAALLLVAVVRPNRIAPPIGTERSEEDAMRGGTLRLATFVNVRGLEPATAYDEGSSIIGELLFGHLLTWDDAGRIVPDLASEFDASPDGRTYRFQLRRGVRFHDGAELTAADVKRSLERTLHPKTPCPAASLYDGIAGFADFHAGKAPELRGVRVVGDFAVEIELDEPDATFPALLTMHFAAPVCPSSGRVVDAKNPAPACGAGPFRLERFEPEASVRLVRHEAYHRPGRPYLDAIEWSINVRPITQRYKFEDGDLDLVADLSPTDAGIYAVDPRWAGRGRWVAKKSINAIFMNTEMAPFDDRAMRRAVALAIDPEVLARVRPDVMPIDRVVPRGIPGPEATEPMRRHDLAGALAEMARAGYPFDPATGAGGYPHEIDYVAVPDSFEQYAAEIYQQQLARVGIRIRLRLVTFATYLAETSRRRSATMGWVGWRADFPDASNFFEPTLSSKAIHDEHSNNRAFFSNAELDAVLARAHAERSTSERFRLYARAEEIVRDEAPWVPTHAARGFEIWHPYVRGYEPHSVVPLRVADAWLDRGGRPANALAAALALPARRERRR